MKTNFTMRKFHKYLLRSALALAVPFVIAGAEPSLWVERIDSEDPAVRSAALADLNSLSAEEKRQVAVILASVLHRGAHDAEHAASGLAQLGPNAEPALADLVYSLSYDEESVAVAVSSAIVPMGAKAVPALSRALDDSNFFVRRRAAHALGQIGPAAVLAAPRLIDALSDVQYDVYTAAENALMQIGPAAIPSLSRAMTKSDERLRRQLIRILGSYGQPSAIVLMETARHDDSGFVRVGAIDEIARLQPLPKGALDTLMAALRDLDEGVRGGAVDALSSLGKVAQPALPLLTRLSTNDTDSLVRQKALDAVAAISAAK